MADEVMIVDNFVGQWFTRNLRTVTPNANPTAPDDNLRDGFQETTLFVESQIRGSPAPDLLTANYRI
jgi:hypothetical protein